MVTSGLASREARNVEGIRAGKERERVFTQARGKNENVLDLTQGSKADFFLNNIYLVTTLLMTILTFTWRKNKNKVQEIKEKYDVTAFATN